MDSDPPLQCTGGPIDGLYMSPWVGHGAFTFTEPTSQTRHLYRIHTGEHFTQTYRYVGVVEEAKK